MYCTVQRNDKIFWWIVRQEFARWICDKIVPIDFLRQGFATSFGWMGIDRWHMFCTLYFPRLRWSSMEAVWLCRHPWELQQRSSQNCSGGPGPYSPLSGYSSDIAVDQYCFQYYVIKQVHIFWMCRKYITRYASCYFKQANWPNSVVSGRASN